MRSTLVLLIALLAPPALASARPVVTVLYFENQTNQRDYDVLQKGLADMMVTDLVASDAVDVVERERLEAVLGELKLQRSKAFDPATVQKLGRLVGASHAVAGAFQEVKDTLRLSVRVIELSSNKVLVTQDVTGPKDDLFVLQERLVGLLLQAMNVKLGAAPPVKSARDVVTLLSYSRAVDAADQGDFIAASARISEVLQRAPTFELGQDFKLALQKRMAAAGGVRAQGLEQQRQALEARAAQVLSLAPGPIVSMQDLQAARHLTYRVIHAQCVALALKSVLTPRPVHNVPLGASGRALGFVDTYVKDVLALEAELTAWRGPFKWLPDPQDRPLLDALGLGPPSPLWLANVPGVPRREVALSQLTGAFTLAGDFSMRPTPCELDGRRVDGAVKAVDEAVALLSGAPAKVQPQEEVVATLDAKARGLMLAGRREAAAQTWQRVLERYPQSKQYAAVESHLKDALDVSPAAVERAQAERALAKAVSACDAEKTPAALAPVLDARFAEAGLWGVTPVVDEVEKACGKRPAFASGLAKVLAMGAGYAERHGDCALFDDYLRRVAAVAPAEVATVRSRHPGCVK
ncbi:MAG: CsgG/HfaB family protein [Myxococcota bacterium]